MSRATVKPGAVLARLTTMIATRLPSPPRRDTTLLVVRSLVEVAIAALLILGLLPVLVSAAGG